MIRLKVFISSAQKELRRQRVAVGSLLATDPFLSETTVPRIFEDYPAPLVPNKKAYLELLRTCHIYLLIIGKEYGTVIVNGLSAVHQEYRFAQDLKLPTLVCVMGDASFEREEKTEQFFEEITKDGHTYSRFSSDRELLEKVRIRLVEYIETTFDTAPTQLQDIHSKETLRSASNLERQQVNNKLLSGLDQDLAREMVSAAEEKPIEKVTDELISQALLSRGYLWWDKQEEVYRPTAACFLLLAPNPSTVFPQTRIQLDAYAGDNRNTNPIDSILLDNPLPQAIEQTVAFIRRNTAHPLKVRGLKRQDSDAYPQEALREAIVNAVAHRDYGESEAKITVEVFQNEIMFSSPGLPPGGQSIDRISRGDARSRVRNPMIVQGLRWLEYMDERGSGIRRMRFAMKEKKLPVPQFRINNGEFSVTLYDTPAPDVVQPATTEKEDIRIAPTPDNAVESKEAQLIQLVRANGHATTAMCVQKLGFSRDTAWRLLSRLTKEGVLKKTGSGRGTRYYLTKAPDQA
ncbi:MAG: DUF4062 domain-containing protein [Desulfobacteraceae bacterium]|nr:DUF4062 domain-containing protein [Desulfobacteraceae bacterium]